MAEVKSSVPRPRIAVARAAVARVTRSAVLGAICAALLLAMAPLSAQAPDASLPALTQPVNDFAGVIAADASAEMDRRIRSLQRATGDVVAVATVDTFAPYGTIDDYAVKLFENHGRGIGVKGKDNGALIVVAVKDKKVRIEVGYDLEEFITDGYAGETIRDEILPRFRQGDYGGGLLAGTTRIINRIAERRGVKLDDVPQPAPSGPSISPGMIFFIILILFFVISSFTRRPPRRRFWGAGPWSGWNSGVGPFGGGSWGGGFGGFGGGGGGGGFGGFGGGGSGGGGASGGW